MKLEFIDWSLIILYIGISLFIGLWFKNRAGKSMSNFFLGGRNLPWYIVGISMVATTFGADTPLAVNELVNKSGISGNWLWWNFLIGGMLTTFFFAKYWRRANIMTELELIELRYSGKPASFLRGFKAVYLGLFMNCLILGWPNVALMAMLNVFFGIPPSQTIWYVALAMVISASYSSLSGYLGVAVTDAIQFVIAMTGAIVLAVVIISSEQIGGIAGLKEQLPEATFSFFPKIASSGEAASGSGITSILTISLGAFLAYLSVQWWASWYPGSEPGGGGYVAQRMMSTRNEKDSVWATLFFQIAHYALRPWPWILVGLATIILYPELSVDDKKLGYVMAIRDFLPAGVKGLLLIALLAAYMSTISTHLNWGASYLVNDLYKRFIRPEKKFPSVEKAEKHYVFISRIFTIVIMLFAIYVTTLVTSISGAWKFLIECGAGLGLVLILRWYWWRINAWSEISATIAPFIGYAASKLVFHLEFPDSFFLTVGFTTLTWIIVTYITPATSQDTLRNFYSIVRPHGNWRKIYSQLNIQPEKGKLAKLFISWGSSVSMTYSVLFFFGKFIFKEYDKAAIWFLIALVSFLILKRSMKGSFDIQQT